MNYNSKSEQINLNVHGVHALLVEGHTTEEARSLIHSLTGKKLSARELVNLARSKQAELPYSQGKLTVRPSPRGKNGRYWLWDIYLVPNSYLAA